MQKYTNMNSFLISAKMDKKKLDFKGSFASVVLIKKLVINYLFHYHRFSEIDFIQVV